MIKRISETLLLRPQDLKPLRDDFTVIGVFNPGAVRVNDELFSLHALPKSHVTVGRGSRGCHDGSPTAGS